MGSTSDAVSVIQIHPTRRRDLRYQHRYARSGLQPLVSGRWNLRFVLLRVLLPAVPILISSLSPAAARADAMVATEEICMPEGTYPMIGGGTTVFSYKSCFSRPVTNIYPWEKKIPRTKMSAPDPFNGARVVRYDYHDALYHCAKRHMRLPTVEELKALFAYANSAATGANTQSSRQRTIRVIQMVSMAGAGAAYIGPTPSPVRASTRWSILATVE
jgi:hypothetical protein